MIVIGHFLYHGITEREMSRFLYVLICTYCSVGVNLFFLISGYFRIRSVMKSIARLVFTVLFFDCVNYMLLYFTAGPAALYDWIPTLFFPVFRSPYWFLQVYLFLIICSPLINRGIDGMTLNKLRLFILFFSGFNFSRQANVQVRTNGIEVVKDIDNSLLRLYFWYRYLCIQNQA